MDQDKYGLNTHKLMYHTDRVNQWLLTGDTTPIYVEISPSRRCNAKCKFCSYGSLDRSAGSDLTLDTYMNNILPSMEELGVKSVMFCGEGEPLVNYNTERMVMNTKNADIDTSMTTNGILLWEYRSLIGYLTWVKISIDAGTRKTYLKIKGVDKFNDVIDNLAAICAVRKIMKFYSYASTAVDTAIGAQMILLPENYKEVVELAALCKTIGVDYLAIKPFSPSDYTDTEYDTISYSDMIASVDDQISRIDYNILFRSNAFNSHSAISPKCYALPFWAYISSNGDVYPCLSYFGYKEYLLGNITKDTFADIWRSTKRLDVYRSITSTREHCRVSCRMAECNKYLGYLIDKDISQIDQPKDTLPQHVNFI